MAGFLYADSVPVTEAISIRIPKVGDVLDHVDDYFGAVYSIVATPFDMMLPLDQLGIDFTQINNFDVFCLLFGDLKRRDVSLIFGDLDLSKFQFARNQQTGEGFLVDPESDIAIDRAVHGKMSAILRKLLDLPNNNKKAGNDAAKKYLLDRERRRAKRASRNRDKARLQLENYIIALVNAAEFKYDYQSVRDITIYQFYASLKQIVKRVSYDKTMIGYYAGTVKADDIKQEDKTWIPSEP